MRFIRGPTVLLVAVLLAAVPKTEAKADLTPIEDRTLQHNAAAATINFVADFTGYALSMPNILGLELVTISKGAPPPQIDIGGDPNAPNPAASMVARDNSEATNTKIEKITGTTSDFTGDNWRQRTAHSSAELVLRR